MPKPVSSAVINEQHSLAANLVACWPMLEGSGLTSADKTNGGHHLALDAVATSWTTVVGELAIAKADAANRGSTMAANLTLNPSTKSFSIAWQGRQTNDSANGTILGFASALTPVVYMNGSTDSMRINSAAGNAVFTKTLFTTVEHHLLTWNQPTGQMRYYVDGVENATSPITPTISASMEFDSAIGGRLTTGNLIGLMLYLYVWEERILTAAEAVALAANPYAFFTVLESEWTVDDRENGSDVVRHTFDWFSDSSGNCTLASGMAVSGRIERVVIVPSAIAAPTANYDLTLTDEFGNDVLSGQGANLSATVASQVCPGTPLKDGTTTSTRYPAIDGILTLNVSNAGESNAGRVVVFVR